jgi:hypothetical protein
MVGTASTPLASGQDHVAEHPMPYVLVVLLGDIRRADVELGQEGE